MTCLYDGFDIESFEAGRGLWHARIRRADQQPFVIDGICFAAVIGRRGCAASGTALVGLNAGYTFDHSVVAGTAIKPGSGKREPLELLPLRKLGVTFFFAKSRALRLLWRVELRDAAGNVVHTLTNRRQH